MAADLDTEKSDAQAVQTPEHAAMNHIEKALLDWTIASQCKDRVLRTQKQSQTSLTLGKKESSNETSRDAADSRRSPVRKREAQTAHLGKRPAQAQRDPLPQMRLFAPARKQTNCVKRNVSG